jgi:hypothetical protein
MKTLLLASPSPKRLGEAASATLFKQPASLVHPRPGYRAVPFPQSARPLKVGIELNNIYDLELERQVFAADGWYWLQWSEPFNEILKARDIEPLKMVEFLNQVEPWDSKIEPDTPLPLRRSDGTYYQLIRFSGRFSVKDIDQHHSPFGGVVLPLILEARPESFQLGQLAVRLEPDRSQKRILGNYGSLAGYQLKRAWIQEGSNSHQLYDVDRDEIYSELVVNVVYGAEPWSSFLKWILPPLIVMVVVMLAPGLDSSLEDIRMAIPSTALLTLVFLQQTYKSELPSVPYLTFLDELYTYFYFVSVVMFALFLWSSNRLEDAPAQDREGIRLALNRINSYFFWGLLAGQGVVAIVAWCV